MTPEDLVNNALDALHLPRIGSLYDGSEWATIALDLWAVTVDEVLILKPWEFARDDLGLITAGQTPLSPFAYEYLFPTTAIKLLQVKPATLPADPAPIRWLEIYDSRIPDRAILCNLASAIGTFTFRVEDMTRWPPDFIFAVVEALVSKFKLEIEKRDAARRPSQ